MITFPTGFLPLAVRTSDPDPKPTLWPCPGKGAGGEHEPYLPGSASRGLRASSRAAELCPGRCRETGSGAEGSQPASAPFLSGLRLVTAWDSLYPRWRRQLAATAEALDAAPGEVTPLSPLSWPERQTGRLRAGPPEVAVWHSGALRVQFLPALKCLANGEVDWRPGWRLECQGLSCKVTWVLMNLEVRWVLISASGCLASENKNVRGFTSLSSSSSAHFLGRGFSVHTWRVREREAGARPGAARGGPQVLDACYAGGSLPGFPKIRCLSSTPDQGNQNSWRGTLGIHTGKKNCSQVSPRRSSLEPSELDCSSQSAFWATASAPPASF